MRQLFPVPGDVDPVDAYGRLTTLSSGRPRVRLNMIASVDGAATVDGRSGALGGPSDKATFAVLRSLADVVLVGAGTMRAEGYGPARLADDARKRRQDLGLPPVPPIAVISRACQLDWAAPFFAEAEQRPLIVTVASAAAADRARAAEVADVIVSGEVDVDLTQALGALAARGHTNVLAEGGPGIAAQLAADGLIDDVCLTVAPMLVAGRGPRILDGGALTTLAGLELECVLEADGYLFLRYARRP
jgi:riboflavin biosynthesis pyrimidine reductase